MSEISWYRPIIKVIPVTPTFRKYTSPNFSVELDAFGADITTPPVEPPLYRLPDDESHNLFVILP